MTAKELYVTAKELYVTAKESHVTAYEPILTVKEPYDTAERLFVMAEELFVTAEESYFKVHHSGKNPISKWLIINAQEPSVLLVYHSKKSPNINAKEAHIASKQPYIDTASLLQCAAVHCGVLLVYHSKKSPNIIAKEAHIASKQPYIDTASLLQCAAVHCSVLLVYHGKKSPNINAKEACIASKQPYLPYINTASVLQCVAVCGKCVAVCCSINVYCHTIAQHSLCCSVLQYAVSVLQCVAVRGKYITVHNYGVATISRMLKNIGLFCKRALQKRPIFCKETCIFKHPTNRSHPPWAGKGNDSNVNGILEYVQNSQITTEFLNTYRSFKCCYRSREFSNVFRILK